MKKYYRMVRRRGNAVFYGVLGAVFIGLGVMAIFFMNEIWAAVCFAAGALLSILPQFVIFSKYGLQGNGFRYGKCGIVRTASFQQVHAVVICVYDEYRRWKGFVPAYFELRDGRKVPFPAILCLKKVNEDDLDLCDTRTHAKLTFRGGVLFDGALEFDFLEELVSSAYDGDIFVSQEIYDVYHPVFEKIQKGGREIKVYDRIPQKLKREIK